MASQPKPQSIQIFETLSGMSMDELAARMVSNPRATIEHIASHPHFAHLGSDAADFVAQALGFNSLDDADVKFAEFQKLQRPQ